MNAHLQPNLKGKQIQEATNKEWVIQTLIHEYIHYLQSPLWMKRYYDMGYEYDTHPYELAATKAEDNWKTFA